LLKWLASLFMRVDLSDVDEMTQKGLREVPQWWCNSV
jgi:hypothetical protein